MKKHVLEHMPNHNLIEMLSELSEADRSLFKRGVSELLFRIEHFMNKVGEDLNDIDNRLDKLEGDPNEDES